MLTDWKFWKIFGIILTVIILFLISCVVFGPIALVVVMATFVSWLGAYMIYDEI